MHPFDRAQSFVSMLNDGRDKPDFEPIERLVEQITRFDEIARKKRYKKELVKNADVGSMGEEARNLMGDINEFFYRMKISISLGRPTENGWTSSPTISNDNSPYLCVLALIVFEAAVEGYIRLIRKCSICKTWFVVRRKVHKFCSDGCREKWFRATPQGKAKRAKYMRRYRAGLKRRDIENLRVAIRRRAK